MASLKTEDVSGPGTSSSRRRRNTSNVKPKAGQKEIKDEKGFSVPELPTGAPQKRRWLDDKAANIVMVSHDYRCLVVYLYLLISGK